MINVMKQKYLLSVFHDYMKPVAVVLIAIALIWFVFMAQKIKIDREQKKKKDLKRNINYTNITDKWWENESKRRMIIHRRKTKLRIGSER